MEVVNEAEAPEVPPVATPHEAEEAADAPLIADAPAIADASAIADAPAPPPPEATPLAPAPPGIASLAEDEAPPFQKSTFRALVAAPLWAGLLGSGTWFWSAGMLLGLRDMELVSVPKPGLVFFPFFVAVVLVLARGFRAPVRSYGELVGRLFWPLFFGLLWSAPAGLTAALLTDALGLRHLGTSVVLMLLGAPMSALALARIHGLGAEKPRRTKLAVIFAAALFLSCWPGLPSLRCQLGFAEGCRVAAESNGAQGDYRAAGDLGAKGCRNEDGFSCRLAGEAYQHEGPARSLRLAEDMFREGCALGDPTSCDRVHGIELERRCERYGAFACVELAKAHASGIGVERSAALAIRFYRKACLLGADDGCERAARYR